MKTERQRVELYGELVGELVRHRSMREAVAEHARRVPLLRRFAK